MGTAEQIEVRRAGAHVGVGVGVAVGSMGAPPASGPDKLQLAKLRTQAKDALIKMGWKPTEAQAAIVIAATRLDASATIEAWLREALRHCPLSARARE